MLLAPGWARQVYSCPCCGVNLAGALFLFGRAAVLIFPARGGVRKFDEITVFFFPDAGRLTLGTRVGIEQFELLPR